MSFPWLGSSWMPVHCRPPCWRTCLPERGTLHSLIRPKTTTTRPLSRSDAAVVAFRYWAPCGVADVRRGRTSSARRWHTCNPLHAHFSVSRRLTSKSVLGGIGCGCTPYTSGSAELTFRPGWAQLSTIFVVTTDASGPL
ncbi:hypothetical protein F5883DRAFT_5050 [Diaporthe sp. PMI_573]|nr:hypothetical protein F5883DRAFT_5050 [Diaporthaceae sp. PMI_573]